MKIAVCEDKASDSAILCAYIKHYCKKHGYDAQVIAFQTGSELLDALRTDEFGIIFLDIFMPGLSGVDVARKIREIDKDCMLVFITASADFAMDAFLVQASGYVTKPISDEKMEGAMHSCRYAFERHSRIIQIPQSGRNIAVSVADMLYAEVYGKHSILHMKRGSITMRLPLDELETHLGGIPFLRCHRSYIVNMNYVEDMQTEGFLMRNGDIVPIRKNGRKEIRMAVAGFIAGSPLEVN